MTIARPEIDRFEESYVLIPETGCWYWTKSKTNSGYGNFKVRRTTYGAHRWSHEYFKGEIPKGWDVAHLCNFPSCVNPDHLQAMTRADNLAMAERFSHSPRNSDTCTNGHKYEETKAVRANGREYCGTCNSINSRKNYNTTKEKK